jgi:predicted glycosyltransferase
MTLVGAVADTFPYLVAADVVVGSAGNNTVMEIATAGTPYVSIPEERPFDEQRRKAEAIAHTGGAMVLPDWPAPERWSDVLSRARALDTRAFTEIVDAEGAKRAAGYIERMAK